MIQFDGGEQWVHSSLLYSLLFSFKCFILKHTHTQNPAMLVIWSWDLIYQEDSSTDIINNTSCKTL